MKYTIAIILIFWKLYCPAQEPKQSVLDFAQKNFEPSPYYDKITKAEYIDHRFTMALFNKKGCLSAKKTHSICRKIKKYLKIFYAHSSDILVPSITIQLEDTTFKNNSIPYAKQISDLGNELCTTLSLFSKFYHWHTCFFWFYGTPETIRRKSTIIITNTFDH